MVDPRDPRGRRGSDAAATDGMGGAFAWPALLRKLDRVNSGYAE